MRAAPTLAVEDDPERRKISARFSAIDPAAPCYIYDVDEMYDDDALYSALLERDATFEGHAWVGVTSTGVFCRLTCPARKPKRENCRFFASVAACLDAGFRACRRCRPLASAADADPLVSGLIAALERDPEHRWTERDLVGRGLDPSTVRRAFRRHLGTTFLAIARRQRLRNGAAMLRDGGKVVDAQLDAGFDSASGFRSALARLLARRPTELTGSEGLRADWIDTPLGAMLAVTDRRALHLLEFFDRRALPNELKRLQERRGPIGLGCYDTTDQVREELSRYFAGADATFKTTVSPAGTAFTQRVWDELVQIPVGETCSYGELARRIGRPTASRAVARANGANPVAILVPCHRVVGADGRLTGYGGGRWRKRRLIDLERRIAASCPTNSDRQHA